MMLGGVDVGHDLRDPHCPVWKHWYQAPSSWKGLTRIMWKTTKDHRDTEGDDYEYPSPPSENRDDGAGNEASSAEFLARVSRMNEL